MSTGGGENEIVSSLDLVFRLVADEQASLAQLLWTHAKLKEALAQIPLKIDIQTTQGMGEQIQRAVEEAANKWKLSFKAMAAPTELSDRISALRTEFTTLATAAEKAKSAIDVVISGERGRGTFTLKGKSDVPALIEEIARQGPILAPTHFKPLPPGAQGPLQPTQTDLGIRLGMQYTPSDPDARKALHTIETSLGSMNEETEARHANIKATKKATEEMSYWREGILSWGRGARPQRGVSEVATGFLQNALGMGEIPASLLGGAAGMIGGGAMFHIGWAITDALSKIPQKIEQEIAFARQFADLQALAGRTNMEPLVAPQRALFSQLGRAGEKAGPAEFQADLTALLSTMPDKEQWAERATRWMTQAMGVGLVHPLDVKNPLETAHAIYRMFRTQGTEGRGEIAGIPGIMNELVAKEIREEREKYGHQTRTDQQIRQYIQDALKQPQWLTPPDPSRGFPGRINPYALSYGDIYQAWVGYATTPQTERAVNQRMDEYRVGHARETWFRLWRGAGQISEGEAELIDNLHALIKGGKFDARNKNPLLNMPGAPPPYLTHRELPELEEFRKARGGDAKKGITITETDRPALEKILSREFGVPSDLVHKQWQKYLGASGDINAMMGGPAQPFNMPPWGQPQFSFSSLSGFANKMQTEAGIHIDYAQETAQGMQQANQHLAQIARNTGGGNVDTVGSPAMGQNLQGMPAIWQGN